MKTTLAKMVAAITRVVPDGERHTLPAGFCIAYYDPADDLYVALPLGIHWVARLWRRAWEWSLWYQPSRWERIARQMLEQHAHENCAMCFANDDVCELADDAPYPSPEEPQHEHQEDGRQERHHEHH
jgi:hypothetical protein